MILVAENMGMAVCWQAICRLLHPAVSFQACLLPTAVVDSAAFLGQARDCFWSHFFLLLWFVFRFLTAGVRHRGR